jgi:hypothetical protein
MLILGLPEDVAFGRRSRHMRTVLVVVALLLASPACAEIWTTREGECGEWQTRWDVQQEQSGVWIGWIDHFHIGGPCERPTGRTLRSEVRAGIAGENIFASRITGDDLCSYTGRLPRENRARGVLICEGGQRCSFVMRFRSPPDPRALREVPPDNDLLTNEQRQ